MGGHIDLSWRTEGAARTGTPLMGTRGIPDGSVIFWVCYMKPMILQYTYSTSIITAIVHHLPRRSPVTVAVSPFAVMKYPSARLGLEGWV
jgi:hypothetical protein